MLRSSRCVQQLLVCCSSSSCGWAVPAAQRAAAPHHHGTVRHVWNEGLNPNEQIKAESFYDSTVEKVGTGHQHCQAAGSFQDACPMQTDPSCCRHFSNPAYADMVPLLPPLSPVCTNAGGGAHAGAGGWVSCCCWHTHLAPCFAPSYTPTLHPYTHTHTVC
jgi:hypothetical protein